MNVTGNTILITGGASGIGLAMARRFVERDNVVVICGRREDKLVEAKSIVPNITTFRCDLAQPGERERLVRQILREFPATNILINNAGIQRSVDLKNTEPWDAAASELRTNLEAPIHLSRMFFPYLAEHRNPAIVNVTSGLSFVPIANLPIYCATKAALHSLTLSMRWQFRQTNVEVVEIIPPAVDTDLQAPGLHTFGVGVDEFADHVFKELEAGKQEIAYGTAEAASVASREQLDKIYHQMNESFS